jgi:hypothetical protein
MDRPLSRVGNIGKWCEILVGIPGYKRLFRRHRLRWEDIKMGLKETGCKDVLYSSVSR